MTNLTRPLTLLLGLLLCASAAADGLIIATPRPRDDDTRRPRGIGAPVRDVPLQVDYHKVKVDISGPLAETRIDQVFANPRDITLEGTYIFPVPRGASINAFSMDVNGTQQAGEVQEAEAAEQVYESIVRRVEDPALLQYIGTKVVRMRIFPIAGRSKKRVKIKYAQELASERGLVAYRYPLNTEKFSAGPLKEVSIEVKIKETVPIGNIYSPSHPIQVSWIDERTAVVRFEAREVKPHRDFLLYYMKQRKDVGISTLAYKGGSGDGYFAAVIAPQLLGQKTRTAKDVVFVVDTSHSMKDGQKMTQVRKSLTYCVNRLVKGDRFNIVDFSTIARQLNDDMTAVDDTSLAAAVKYVAEMTPTGGTNMADALSSVARLTRQADTDRPFIVVFLTDGQPTIGTRDTQALINVIGKGKRAPIRLFTIGVGHEVDARMLDLLSSRYGGTSTYIEPGENLELKVRALFDKVAAPVLSSVSLTCEGEGVGITEVYPRHMPDLFEGSQIVVFGRYTGSGKALLQLAGKHRGERMTFVHEVAFGGTRGDNAFLAHLWAKRKIGHLMDRIRLEGEKDTLRKGVVSLAKSFGILTPYTGYLVLEDENQWARNFERTQPAVRPDPTSRPARPRRAPARAFNMMFNLAKRGAAAEAMKAGSGAAAVRASRTVSDLRDGDQLGADHLEERAAVRHVGDRTFYRDGERWVDAAYDQAAMAGKLRKVPYLSKAYFGLLKTHRGIGRYLALGKRVVVVTADGAIEITPKP